LNNERLFGIICYGFYQLRKRGNWNDKLRSVWKTRGAYKDDI